MKKSKFEMKCNNTKEKRDEATLPEGGSLAFDIQKCTTFQKSIMVVIGSGGSMVILSYLVRCFISFNAGSGKVL